MELIYLGGNLMCMDWILMIHYIEWNFQAKCKWQNVYFEKGVLFYFLKMLSCSTYFPKLKFSQNSKLAVWTSFLALPKQKYYMWDFENINYAIFFINILEINSCCVLWLLFWNLISSTWTDKISTRNFLSCLKILIFYSVDILTLQWKCGGLYLDVSKLIKES